MIMEKEATKSSDLQAAFGFASLSLSGKVFVVALELAPTKHQAAAGEGGSLQPLGFSNNLTAAAISRGFLSGCYKANGYIAESKEQADKAGRRQAEERLIWNKTADGRKGSLFGKLVLLCQAQGEKEAAFLLSRQEETIGSQTGSCPLFLTRSKRDSEACFSFWQKEAALVGRQATADKQRTEGTKEDEKDRTLGVDTNNKQQITNNSLSPRRPLNQTIVNCPPSGIRRFFDIAQQMENVISLGVGEPDFATPWNIRQAGIEALEQGRTTYTSNSGLPKLRQSICDMLARRYGTDYDADTECLITVGVSEGLDLALRVLLNAGDEVLVPEPCYVSYMPCVQFAGGVPIGVPTDAQDGFRLHAERLEERITPRTKAILLASPANPTGATQSREDLQTIVALAQKHDLYLLSDEIYDRLTYVGRHTCLGALPGARERTFVFNGFSKAYAMTGWRIGYVCAPQPLTTLMTRVHQYTMLCAPTIAQVAAIEAIAGAEREVEDMVADYDRRRRLIVPGLNRLGLDCPDPQGAFYAFPSVRRYGLSSEEFAERLLMEERVAVVPGTAFGPSGTGHVRCSYATSTAQIEEALERIGRFVGNLKTPAQNSVEEQTVPHSEQAVSR